MGLYVKRSSASIRWILEFPLLLAMLLPVACKTVDHLSESVVLKAEDQRETTALLERIQDLNEQGKYAEAIPQALRVLDIVEREKGPEHEAVGVCLNVLGGLYTSFGDLENAETALKRALQIYRSLGREGSLVAATTLGLLAKVHMNRGEHQTAKSFAEKALAIRERVQGGDPFMISTSLNTLGEIHMYLGEFDNAEDLLRRAIKLRKSHENPHGLVISLNNLARLYYQQGDTSAAAPLAEAALELGEYALGDTHPHLADTFALLGKIHAAEGRYEQAFVFLKKAQEIDFLAIDHMKGFTSEIQKLQFVQKMEEDLQVFLSLIILKMPYSSRALEEGMNTLLRRKGIILEVQKQFQEALVLGDERTSNAFQRLSDVRSHITRMFFSGPGDKGLAVYRQQLDRLRGEKEGLERELSSISRPYSVYLEMAAAQSRNVAALLNRNKGQALVEIARLTPYRFEASARGDWDHDRYVAFVLLPVKEGEVRVADLGDAATIDALILRFKSEISSDSPGKAKTVILLGEELYATVFKPIEGKLGNARHLYLSPDGNLNLVPFEVFRKPGRGFLIEEYIFNYVSSGRDILGFGKAMSAEGMALIMGDPDFDAALKDGSALARVATPRNRAGALQGLRFERLPETLEEVRTIQEILGKTAAELFTGDAATEKVLRHATRPRLLHLATHGFFLQDIEIGPKALDRGMIVKASEDPPVSQSIRIRNPLIQSGFVLAGANRALASTGLSEFEGVVTAEKILGLKLRGAEMVVMSACNTGVGEVKRGEGVFGLRRAFTQAGARSLVMSMWPVPDKETMELMIAFYRNILSGKTDRCEALRNAALKQMRIARDRYGHPDPLYWGAFVFMGEP